MSLMSSSLLLQQCPACLVHLTWIFFMSALWGAASRTCSVLLAAFLCSWGMNPLSSQLWVYGGTKHNGLVFWELWAELLRITWPTVMWHFEKQLLPLFGSGYQSERTPLFHLCFFIQHMHANYPMWTFYLHQKNVSFYLLLSAWLVCGTAFQPFL